MKPPAEEFIRYVINGIVATSVHYCVLTFNLVTLALPSAGLANLIASMFGIATSFLGSRFFVFRKHDMPMTAQALKFGALYATIAVLHGGILLLWTDTLEQDYRIGFLIATFVQFLLSYVGNKFLVFSA
ncbi:MAG: GtrA family protein [Hyphomicrobiaceae bacterium]|nr:GtrA family protein [Hyphomicrobiaceae bacterium]